MVGYNAYSCLFTNQAFNQLTNIYYCNQCFRSNDLFGCVGLSGKKYCILNKEYPKDEYDKIVFIGDYMDAPYRKISDVKFSDGLNDKVIVDAKFGRTSGELLYNLK